MQDKHIAEIGCTGIGNIALLAGKKKIMHSLNKKGDTDR